MNIPISIFKILHIASAVLLACLYYVPVAVNRRTLLGPPLGDLRRNLHGA